jgi:hypothetical protein
MKCQAQVPRNLNFPRYHPCSNNAREGSEFCGVHQPKERKADPAKERYKLAVYVAGLRLRLVRGDHDPTNS